MLEKEITFDSFIRGLLVVAGLSLAIFILNRLSMILLPFFVAWFLAYMIYPMVKFFQFKLRLRNRILAIMASLLVILAALGGFFWLIIPPAIDEFVRFRTVLADVVKAMGNSALAQNIELYLQQNFDQNAIIQLMHEDKVMDALKIAFNQLWTLLSQTFDFLVTLLGLFMAALYLFFILKDYEKMSEGWVKLIPKRSRRFATALADDVQRGMNSYFRGQGLVAFLVGILFSIGFLIIDFPLAIPLGLFIGFLNIVPYMQAVGIIPTILLALMKANDTGENFWFILFVTCIVFVVVQVIQDAYLVPKIMGKIMGLNPAVILLSLSVWGYMLGLIGLIIALPMTTLLLSYYRRFIERDERRLMLTEKRLRRMHQLQEAGGAAASNAASHDARPGQPNVAGGPESAADGEATQSPAEGKGVQKQ